MTIDHHDVVKPGGRHNRGIVGEVRPLGQGICCAEQVGTKGLWRLNGTKVCAIDARTIDPAQGIGHRNYGNGALMLHAGIGNTSDYLARDQRACAVMNHYYIGIYMTASLQGVAHRLPACAAGRRRDCACGHMSSPCRIDDDNELRPAEARAGMRENRFPGEVAELLGPVGTEARADTAGSYYDYCSKHFFEWVVGSG